MNRLYVWAMTAMFWLGLPALAWANGATGSHHGPGSMGHGGWYGGYGMMLGPLMMILFIAIATVVVVLIVRWLGPSRSHTAAVSSALDVLEQRFARGEVDAEEFQERRRILNE